MTVRVMLISPAMNAALREARFDGDALDRSGRERAKAAADAVPHGRTHAQRPLRAVP